MDALPVRLDGVKVYGGFWRRLLAGVLDVLVLLPLLLCFPLLRVAGRGWAFLAVVPAALAFVLLNVLFNAYFGGTPGKLAVRLRITRPDGAAIGWREAWLRSSVDLGFAALFALGEFWLLMQPDAWPYLWPELENTVEGVWGVTFRIIFILQNIWIWSELIVLLFNRRRRAIHDFIAGTVVVKQRFAARHAATGKPAWLTAGIVAVGIAGIVAFLSLAGRDIPLPDISDLEPGRITVAPEDNAYTDFAAATNVLHGRIGDEQAWTYFDENPDERDAVRDLLDRNAEAFSLIRKGIDAGTYQAPEIRDFDALIPHIQSWLTMGRLLALQSRVARADGHYDEALDSCVMLLEFGNLLQSRPDSLIGYLVGIAVLDMGLTEAGRLMRVKELSDDALTRIDGVLADLAPLGPGLVQAIKVESVLVASVIDKFRARFRFSDLGDVFMSDVSEHGVGAIPVPRYLFQPNATLQIFADGYRTVIANADAVYADMPRDEELHSSWPPFDVERLILRPNIVGQLLYQMLHLSWDGLLSRRCYIETRISALRLINTMLWHERKLGHLPASLEVLFPVYIEAVPRDPFDGKPFRYDADRGVVYSVGKNLEDRGGGETPDVFGAAPVTYGWDKADDLVFYVRDRSDAGSGDME